MNFEQNALIYSSSNNNNWKGFIITYNLISREGGGITEKYHVWMARVNHLKVLGFFNYVLLYILCCDCVLLYFIPFLPL